MIIPVGYAQVNFIYTGVSVPRGAQWTLGIDNTTNDNSAEDLAIGVCTAHASAGIQSLIGNGCNLVGVLAKVGPNSTGASFFNPFAVDGTGGAAADNPGSSTLVHKATNSGGRAGRGRTYLPCIPDASVGNGGAVTTTFQADVNDRMNDFLLALSVAEIPAVVLHAEGSPLGSPTPITGYSCDPQIATQRRRNRR